MTTFLQFLIGLAVLVAAALPVAAVLAVLALLMSALWLPFPLQDVLGVIAWNQSQAYVLVAVPLFILLGEIMLRSGSAGRMYGAIAPWLSRLPGELMHTNIASCALFAATSGSSVATAATVGTVAVPEIHGRGYNERLFLGSLAAGGTLGILIPPSINMIVYGALTNTSVPQLYLAGFVPGLVLTAAFMMTIGIACLIRPDWGGRPAPATWTDRRRGLPHLLPPLVLFLVVVGSIYAGIATPTEAAALGVLAALGIAAFDRALSFPMLHRAFEGTMKTTAMLMLILLAAFFLNFGIASVGFVNALNDFVTHLGWGPVGTMAAVVAFYLALGCVLDGLSLTVLTVPVLTPVVVNLGYDPVWFGVIVMLVTEAGLITPPIGMNCYVVQGVRGAGRLDDVFIGVLPFLGAMLAVIALLIAFPGIALWLPRSVFG